MYDFLMIASAIATIASFLLEVLQKIKLKRKDGKGKKKQEPAVTGSKFNYPHRPPTLYQRALLVCLV